MDWNDFATIGKDIIETLYYIAGIVLVAGVILGRKQLTVIKQQLVLLKEEADLLKRDFQVRNQRASIEKSIEYLNWFAIEFIPQMEEFNDKIDENRVKKYRSIKGQAFIFDSTICLSNDKTMESIVEKRNNGAINLMNQIEFFSAAMTSGLADEELAFNPLAHVFCEFIETNYDVYCDLRHGGRDTMYTKSIELYEIWKERLESLELEKKQQEIDAKKSKMQHKRIKSLGND